MHLYTVNLEFILDNLFPTFKSSSKMFVEKGSNSLSVCVCEANIRQESITQYH